MGGFLLRKVGAALIVILLASMLVFLGVRALPGDPALALGGEERDPAVLAQIRHDYGLDQPLPIQYVRWVGHVLRRRPRHRPAQALGLAHDRDAAADHARARRPRDRVRLGAGHRRRRDRGGPAGQGIGLRGDDGRARRALRAALLARPADDHPVRGRPALAAGRRLRPLQRGPDREPRAHADAGDRARRRAVGGGDAADALGDARLAGRRLRPHGAREGPLRALGGRQARAAEQPDHGDDDHRAPARCADLGSGDHRADLRHRRLRAADDRRRPAARLRAHPGGGAGRRGRLRRRQSAGRHRVLTAEPADPRSSRGRS